MSITIAHTEEPLKNALPQSAAGAEKAGENGYCDSRLGNSQIMASLSSKDHRTQIYAMRRLSSQWLFAKTFEGIPKLQHHQGDDFVDTNTGELFKRPYITPPRPATCSWTFRSTVSIKTSKNGKAYYDNVERCSSIWACPVCSELIRSRRAQEITQAVQQHQKNGGQVVFLTLTIRHDRKDALALTLDTVLEGWKKLMGSRKWKNLKQTHAVSGYVRAVETTVGQNGWHPHLHVLLFLENKVSDAELQNLGDGIFDFWGAWCFKKLGKMPTRERGIDLQRVDEDGAVLSRYISKVQTEKTEKWSVGSELSRADIKRGRVESWTPFQLLTDSTSLMKNTRYVLWNEFVEASKGRRCITWSRGLKERFGIGEITDEQAIYEAEKEASLSFVARSENYKGIAGKPEAVMVLVAAEYDDWDTVQQIMPGVLIPDVSEPAHSPPLPADTRSNAHTVKGSP